jgi:hypothetical protein
MKKTLWCIIALASWAAAPVMSQDAAPRESELNVSRQVDWAHGRIVLEITRALDPSTQSLVRAKADAETELEQRLPGTIAEAVGPLTVDSSHSLSDYFAADPGMYARLTDVALRARRTDLFLTPDFSALVARYEIPFFGDEGIAAPLFPAKANPVRRRLGDVITRAYTGILIFAQGDQSAGGTALPVRARPALFPRIWDEQMSLVLDKGMCAPESLARWGMVGYSRSIDDPAADLRVGNLPLRLAARRVFGDKDTDVVISVDGARQILSLPENIALLREGKIMIVYDSLDSP